MTIKIIFLSGIIFAGISASAGAGTVAIFGEPDCGKWVESSTATRKAWLLGYLSGMNTMDATKGDALEQLQSAEQAFLWMDNYCRANPLNGMSNGAVALFFELTKRSPQASKR